MMENKLNRQISAVATLLITALLQPSILKADELCRDIGGTGIIANSCAQNSKKDIGGTGHNDGGIGGTGITASTGGIGGTGHAPVGSGIGGTGIVGTITGFGSIWVNGIEVKYDAQTPVADNAAVANSTDLAIGQVVTIEASENNDEYRANKISVVDAVAGQITSFDMSVGKLNVLGQTVDVTPKTIIHDPQKTQGDLQLNPGDYVKISGLRLANGEIVASHIERTNAFAEPNLVGPITRKNGNLIEIYGLQILTGENTRLSTGQEILVYGKLVGGVLLAREITPSPASQLYGKTGQIRLQGYLSGSASEGSVRVGNLEVEVPDTSSALKEKLNLLNSDALVQVSGHFVSEHKIIADKIEFDRSRPEIIQHDNLSGQARDISNRVDHIDKTERIDRLDRTDYIDRPDHPDSPNRSDSSDRDDATEPKEHSNK
jgi:hypothetical protein